MVARSLIFKVYGYAIAAFLLLFVLAVGGARLLIDEGRQESFRRAGQDNAAFIGQEVEVAWTGVEPPHARLTTLGQALHYETRLDPLPPGDVAKIEPLARADGGPPREYRVRLDVGGKPRAVLHLESTVWRGGPANMPAIAAAVWMAVLALMIVPPLVLWVLRPLRRMVETAHRLGAGDLETPVPTSRTDEFGELERAFEGMRQRVQRMLAQRDRLLGDISHELRGPLGRMALALPLARETGEAEFYDDLKREVHAMDDMIGELLDFARGRTPAGHQREALDLADLARELGAERALQAESRGVALTMDLAASAVVGDRRLLRRALGNLVDNAVKYTPRGGHVRLTTARQGDTAVARVVDDGPGLEPGHLAHVFEPFWRPDVSRSRETGGVGLGLAIVRAIAEGHGGTVTLDAAPGKGTAAEIRLPFDAG